VLFLLAIDVKGWNAVSEARLEEEVLLAVDEGDLRRLEHQRTDGLTHRFPLLSYLHNTARFNASCRSIV
jgi:hypothetical protein